MQKDKVTVIRQHPQPLLQPVQNPILTQLSSIPISPSLLTQLKPTQLSYRIQSLTSILQNIHQKFSHDIQSVSIKQQQLINKVENNKFGTIPKLNIDLDKTVKRFGEYMELKKEKDKYRTLTGMMNKALESIEQEVDGMMEREIQKKKK